VAQNLLLDAIDRGPSRLPYWTGERRNRRRKKEDQVEIDVSHEALAAGSLGPDRVWRNIVNIEDADLAAATCSTSTSLRTNTRPTSLPTCSCASSSTTACPRSSSTT
jgi:hypothetical protein